MVELLLGNLLNVLDRLIQLSTYRQQARQKLLEQHIAPVFAAFEAVHGQYLSSFEKYRKILKTTTDPLTSTHPIFDEIRTDNLFSEHQRTRIVHLSHVNADAEVALLVKLIHDYLIDVRVASDPIDGYANGRFSNPQLWRRTLLRELEAIFDESWQIVLDRSASQPPLYGPELEDALLEARKAAGIQEDDADKHAKMKVAFAVRALDEVVRDMQEEYGKVSNEYGRLHRILSK